MSRYTVVWWPAALDELTDLWLQSEDRAAVTADAREVDRRFAEQASEWGDLVTGNVRVMDLTRIGVYFRIFEEDRRVEVVWVFGLPNPGG